jgi:hypothetical protein
MKQATGLDRSYFAREATMLVTAYFSWEAPAGTRIYLIALPPISPRSAPKPIFQVVKQASSTLIAGCDGSGIIAIIKLTTSDIAVKNSTPRNVHLNAGVSGFIAGGGRVGFPGFSSLDGFPCSGIA